MSFDRERVAGCIRANRARNRMSRDELAKVSGIPASTIATYENGECGPSLENAWALADVFDLDLDALFERQRKPAAS